MFCLKGFIKAENVDRHFICSTKAIFLKILSVAFKNKKKLNQASYLNFSVLSESDHFLKTVSKKQEGNLFSRMKNYVL